MAQNRPFQILVIDDDLRFTSKPLFEDLVELYGQANVIWKETPQEGLDYLDNDTLSKRTIVILDYFFGGTHKNGLDWFLPLQKKSSLIYIILNTAHSVDEIPQEQLKECINNHLMALVDKAGDGYQQTLLAVDSAIKYLNNRIDCILEEWILRHERFTREKPYLRTAKGEIFSLNDVLSEIRRDTDFGREMSSNIIRTAITLMQRDIDKLETPQS